MNAERFGIYRELFNLKKIPVEFDREFDFLSFYSAPGSNLCFLSSANSNTMDFFTSSDLDVLLEEFRESFDYIVFDMPPLLKFSETKMFFSKVDMAFITVFSGKTKLGDVERCKAIVRESGGKIDGVVLNKQSVPFWARFIGRDAFV